MAKCEIKHCRDEAELVYYNHDICEKHWRMHSNNKIDLKKIFGVEL